MKNIRFLKTQKKNIDLLKRNRDYIILNFQAFQNNIIINVSALLTHVSNY